MPNPARQVQVLGITENSTRTEEGSDSENDLDLERIPSRKFTTI